MSWSCSRMSEKRFHRRFYERGFMEGKGLPDQEVGGWSAAECVTGRQQHWIEWDGDQCWRRPWSLEGCSATEVSIGVSDGKHIQLKKPMDTPSAFYNYKNVHLVSLLGIVDTWLPFHCNWNGAYGRNSDSHVYKVIINSIFQINRNYLFTIWENPYILYLYLYLYLMKHL